MSFAERQERLHQYFIQNNWPGWGEPTQPQIGLQLRMQITRIRFALQRIKQIVDKHAQIRKWKEAIDQMRLSQQRIRERGHIRWMWRAYVNYKYRMNDIEYIYPRLRNTIQQLAPYLSVPQEDPIRLITINNILDSLQIISELLTPIRDFSDLIQADPEISHNFHLAKYDAWDWGDYNDIGLFQMFYYLAEIHDDLRQVFIEENLKGWGSRAPVQQQWLQELDEMCANSGHGIWNVLTFQQYFKSWWLFLDKLSKNPQLLTSERQLKNISKLFWLYQTQFHQMRVFWKVFLQHLEWCAPYLSPPFTQSDEQKQQRIISILNTVGRIRVLYRPFIIVIKGLPHIITGKLPGERAQPAGPSGARPGSGSPYRVGYFGGGPSSAGPSSGSPHHQGYSAGGPSGTGPSSGDPYLQDYFSFLSKQ